MSITRLHRELTKRGIIISKGWVTDCWEQRNRDEAETWITNGASPYEMPMILWAFSNDPSFDGMWERSK